MTTTTTPSRADDARLHELLTGEVTHYDERGYGTTVTSGDINGAYASRDLPEYHDDLAAIRAAELALPPVLQGDYASELINEIVDREDLRGIAPYPTRDEHEQALAYKGIYALITATAQQRAQALVAVLERARAKETKDE